MSETCDICGSDATHLIIGASLADDQFRCDDHKLPSDHERYEYQVDHWK